MIERYTLNDSLMDWLDDFVLGPLDIIDELMAPLLLRSVRMDKIRIPRCDKANTHSLNEVMEHLREHGVECAPGNYNSREMTFYIRKSQRVWLDWLLRFDSQGNTQLVRTRRRWKETQRKPR